jgi:SAM-dependent methyltransferase
MSLMLNLLGEGHRNLVGLRRVRVLATAIAPLVPPGSRVLDIGCGEGSLGALIAQHRANVVLEGYDIAIRRQTVIPVHKFDGQRIPAEDASADVVMFVDVLHHTPDPMVLMREAARVARCAVVIKDHRISRIGGRALLRLMDWVGNRPHDVVLPYNYWPEQRWREAWAELGLTVESYTTEFGLYPRPLGALFERGLHFLVKLSVPRAAGVRTGGIDRSDLSHIDAFWGHGPDGFSRTHPKMGGDEGSKMGRDEAGQRMEADGPPRLQQLPRTTG